MSKIDELIEYVQKDNRVCSKENYWNRFWDKFSKKKNSITFLILVCLFIPQNVLAYVITVKDTSAYQFKNGKYIGANPLYSTSYEVNLDAGEILEIVAEKNIDEKSGNKEAS